MNAVDPRYARLTASQATHMLEMTREVLAEFPDSEHAPKLREHAAALEAMLELRNGPAAAPVAEEVTVGRRAGSPTSNQYGTFTVYQASEKQVGFLRKLIAEKNTDGVTIPTTLDGISKTAASALIDKLIDRPAKQAHVGQEVRPPSEKQIAFMSKLATERDWAGVVQGVNIDTETTDWARVPGSIASKVIDALLAAPRKPTTKTLEVEIAAGAYRVGDRIIRVYLGQQSGKMLAAGLVDATAESRDDAWHYLGMAARFVPADAHRLTVEECEAIAGAPGQSFSWCCVCGRRLDDPNSVSRGIGPVCRAKQEM